MQCRALISTELDPYWNLAVEEQLLDERAGQPDPLLFFWRSQPAVIIGKNQNPWRECNLDWMHEHDVLLARRISGGGAVYHDPGNLNYAVFLPRQTYHADQVFELTIRALQSLGVKAGRMDRTSLAVEGYKVSGHAFCMRRQAVLHHGTLLFDADIDAMRGALRSVPGWDFVTKATASVRATVANLSCWYPEITANLLQDALISVWQCGNQIEHISREWGDEGLDYRRQRLTSQEWLFDQTPEFRLCQVRPSDGAQTRRSFFVKDGHIIEQQGSEGDVVGIRLPRLGQLNSHMFL